MAGSGASFRRMLSGMPHPAGSAALARYGVAEKGWGLSDVGGEAGEFAKLLRKLRSDFSSRVAQAS